MAEATRILADRYRLTGHLARGGMADVYEAEDTLLGRRVAVKILHPQFAGDQAFVSRFRREAQAAANLSHPNIVSIYDWGEEAGTYFMVMELIEGRTLREIRKSEGPLLPRRAAEVAAEAAAALTVAHQAGVYHRDIKPGNIMLTPDGSVKVTDFGIARALDDSEELTRTGAVIGTATYFSPEQAQGLPADERSDVYSLGVVLYELLCGQPPFTGESPVAVAYQHVSEFAPAPSEINPDVPAALEVIVEHAMEKDPGERYQTAAEFRGDLLRYLRGEQPVAMVSAAAGAPTQMMHSATPPPPPTVPPDETARHVAQAPVADRSSQTSYVIAIVGLLLALVAGIFILARLVSGSPSAAGPEVEIPDLAGRPFLDAVSALVELDLKVTQRDQVSADIPAGTVIGTIPEAGTMVAPGSSVTVIVSTGPEQFPVPNFTDITEEDARAQILANDWQVGEVIYRFDEEVPEGIVIDQSPPPGTEVGPGAVISLDVSSGPFALTMPNVVQLTEANARAQLSREGFDSVTINVEEEFSEEMLLGFVVRTVPEAGNLVPRDGTVTLYISKGPEPFEVPDLIGRTLDEARRIATEFGFTLIVEQGTVRVTAASGLDGLIAAQAPAEGTEIVRDAEVRVTLGELRNVGVPNLVGLTQEQAAAELQARGLTLEVTGTTEVASDSGLVGRVASQSPSPGSEVPDGSTIRVTIGEAAATTTTTSTTTTTTTTTTTIAP